MMMMMMMVMTDDKGVRNVMTILKNKKRICLVSHGHRRRIANASLVGRGKHGSVIQEVLELNHRLQYRP